MIQLRDYQQRAVDEVRAAFLGGHEAVLFQLATGGGKTLTAGHILGSAAAKGNDAMFICNRIELVEQTAAAFDRLGIEYGMIAAGYTPSPRSLVQIASIDTLKRRILKPEKYRIRVPKLTAWDECRSLGAAGWTQVYKAFKGSKHLGLDATPIRLDGQGLDAYFSHMVQGPTYSELMTRGSLVPFECYAPSAPDMSGVHTKFGEYDKAEVEAAMDKPTLTGEVASHYVKHAMGKRGITFAVSVKHSQHLAEQYRAAGVPAVHLDGDTDKIERKQVVNAFRRGEIKVLCNVDLFTAGFDVPGVEVITMARPTQSLAVYLQQAGRGSRPDELNPNKKSCLLLDHAGNLFRHGLPDQDREWSLEGRKKGERKKKKPEDDVPVRQCEQCFAVFVPAPACPVCGAEVKKTAREIEQIEGELQRIEKEALAAAKVEAKIAAKAKSLADRREVGQARTLEDLEAIEKARGYSPGWADKTWAARRNGVGQRIAEAQAEAYGGRWR